MSIAAQPTRENRTITVDFRDEATYFCLMADGKVFLESVLAFLMVLGFQLKHKATCRGSGRLTRHSHSARIRLGVSSSGVSSARRVGRGSPCSCISSYA